MRNLKRALSLTLASVMLLGMMVMGSSALSFNDADDISNVTAASILEELGVMQGDGKGNFMPEQTVTRAQMAIIICRIMFGNRLNVDTLATEGRFTDVAPGEYYTGYVNFAAEQGIIGGYGDGRFGPDDTVTTAQAALMLCRGLGYYKAGEDNGDWGTVSLNAISLATRLKMFGDLHLGTNDLLARDNVAEMVFNTMTKAVPVMYNATWNLYYTDSKNVLNGTSFNYLNSWAYQNYDLVYKNVVDDLGNMNTRWGIGKATETDVKGNLSGTVTIAEYNKIIDEENEPILTYDSKKTDKASDIARDLRGYDADNVDLYINGKVTAGQDLTDGTVIAAETGDGYVVKVYANDSGEITSVSVVKENLAKVVSISSAKKEITLLVKLSDGTTANKVVKEADNFYENLVGIVENGDYVLAVVDADDKVNDAYVGETVTGVVTRYTNKGEQTVGGTQYKVSACGFADTDLKAPTAYKNTTDECTLYLDSTDRIIAISNTKELSGEDVCFVAYTQDAGKWGNEYEAYVYLPDGTKGVYTVSSINNSTKSSDLDAFAGLHGDHGTGLYVYTLSSDGKSIALKDGGNGSLNASDFQIARSNADEESTDVAITIDHSKAQYTVGGQKVYMNSATKFYMHNTDKADSIEATNAKDAITASTGLSSVKQVPLIGDAAGDVTVVYRTVNGNKIAIAVYGKYEGEASAASDDLVFITNGKWSKVDAGDEYYYGTAIFTGEDEAREITIKGQPVVGLHAYKTDSQGRYEMDEDFTCGYSGTLSAINKEILYVGATQLNKLNGSNVKIWDVTDEDKPTLTSVSFLDTSKTYFGYAVVDNTTDKNVLAVYICNEVTPVKDASTIGSNQLANEPAGTVAIGSADEMNSASGTSDNAGDTVAIVVGVTTADSGKTTTATIKDASGRTVWEETWTMTISADKNVVWRVSLAGGNGSGSDTTHPYPWSWANTGWPNPGEAAKAGVYSYTVKTSDRTIQSGDFVVETDVDPYSAS